LPTCARRAQEWLRLAYLDTDAEFDRLLTEFNQRQLEIEPDAPAPMRLPGAAQHQPMQKQQTKKTEEDK
jgi:hypothetical protein